MGTSIVKGLRSIPNHLNTIFQAFNRFTALAGSENGRNWKFYIFDMCLIPFVTEELAVFLLLENEILGTFT